MTKPILVIGEALIDIVRPLQGPEVEYPGGSPANVAITIGRLGNDAHLLTWFGADTHGRLLADHLKTSHVTVVAGSDGAARTSTAIAQLDGEGAANYVFDIEWRIGQVTLPQDAAAVHLGSIAAILEPGASDAIQIVQELREDALVTYDPNMRPALMGTPEDVRPRVEELVALSDVVKASDEDLAWLYPGIDIEEIATRWQASGPALVIVTRGADGALAIGSCARAEVPPLTVAVADTVGAGDSFMGALIDHLASTEQLVASKRKELHHLSVEEVTELLTYAARVAAVTVSRPGANPPWREEL